MSTLNDLIADLDRIEALPVLQRPAEKLLIFRRVESALRLFVQREPKLIGSIQKFRPALRELSVRLMAMEKRATEAPDTEMMREYFSTLTRARSAVDDLEKAAQTITTFEDLP